MHRDESVWHDAMKFDPERFMPGSVLPNDAKSLLSGFGAGAYSCK